MFLQSFKQKKKCIQFCTKKKPILWVNGTKEIKNRDVRTKLAINICLHSRFTHKFKNSARLDRFSERQRINNNR